MTHRDVFIVSTARTAIGTFGGALGRAQHPAGHHRRQGGHRALGPGARRRGHVVMGNVIPTDTKDAYLARVAAIDAGCPIETPAFNASTACAARACRPSSAPRRPSATATAMWPWAVAANP